MAATKDIIYIYHLPFFARSEFCKIMNQNDKWEELEKDYSCKSPSRNFNRLEKDHFAKTIRGKAAKPIYLLKIKACRRT
ncbi:hypothetical protein DMN91_007876 [Ooceraea biroi]|uniref:Uncharacterized protein n=1 Tax=Ooceraea biroi TaxID=2015173 RepID=A0A3L8DHC3_OOCBI|nr:hypothetical protein DMN91_007876 [Ooceraea biroi]